MVPASMKTTVSPAAKPAPLTDTVDGVLASTVDGVSVSTGGAGGGDGGGDGGNGDGGGGDGGGGAGGGGGSGASGWIACRSAPRTTLKCAS